MRELTLAITRWIGARDSTDEAEATLAGIEVRGPRGVALSRHEDHVALALSDEVYAPAADIAAWLVANWWRLRWEARTEAPSLEWRFAHELVCAETAFALPPIEISGDGEFVELRVAPQASPDAAAVRYLVQGTFEVPAADFEAAVDDFAAITVDRVSRRPEVRSVLPALVDELQQERGSATLARFCRLEARAGMNPGDDPLALKRLADLAARVGPTAGEEVAAATPLFLGDTEAASGVIDMLRSSKFELDLSALQGTSPVAPAAPERPWQRGERLARAVRARLRLDPLGPLRDDVLAEIVGKKFPLPHAEGLRRFGGAWRQRGARVTTVAPTSWRTGQRFFAGRVLGAALMSSSEDALLAVGATHTAAQKANRAFGFELLCPWAALDAFTDENGLGEDALAAAAERWEVSELGVRSSLVNHHKLPREDLAPLGG